MRSHFGRRGHLRGPLSSISHCIWMLLRLGLLLLRCALCRCGCCSPWRLQGLPLGALIDFLTLLVAAGLLGCTKTLPRCGA